MKIEPAFDPKADSPLSDDALRAKKERYKRFDAGNVVRKIARESLGVALKRVEPIGVGANAFDHLVFRLLTDDKRVLVCRINADVLVAEHFPTEAALYRKWRAAGIPSPEIYNVTLREKPEGLDHMVLESVGTSDLEKHLVQHPEDAIEYARASGAFLSRFHTVPVLGFGMLTLKEGSLEGSHRTWREALQVRAEETLTYLTKHKILSVEHAEKIRSALARHQELLELPHGVTLHGDYHNANIIIDSAKRTVVAAVDLSQAKAGDPLYDIAFYGTYVPSETFAAFCEGYFSHAKKPADFEKKLAIYQLRIYLSKVKLRKRFGYDDRIPAALSGIERVLSVLS